MSAAELFRAAIVLIVMFSSAGWAVSISLQWSGWHDNLRAKMVSCAILPILLTNGYGVAYAATNGYPVTPVTIMLAVWYVVLNLALWFPLPRDPNIPQRRKSDRNAR